MIVEAISFVPLAIWLYLLLGRGWFWRCRERDDTAEMSVPRFLAIDGRPASSPR